MRLTLCSLSLLFAAGCATQPLPVPMQTAAPVAPVAKVSVRAPAPAPQPVVAAPPPVAEPGSREERMSEALKDYESGKSGDQPTSPPPVQKKTKSKTKKAVSN